MPIVSPFITRRNGFLKFKIFNELYRLAGVDPIADFRFDQGSIVDVIKGAAPTFTRPSSTKLFLDGSGVLQTAAADVPTYAFDQATGQRLGIRLNCIAATNINPSARDFTASPWGSAGGVASANTYPSIFATVNAVGAFCRKCY